MTQAEFENHKLAIENEEQADKNIPFLRSEIKEHFRTSRQPLMNVEDNRKTRRAEAKAALNYDKPMKQVCNNRAKTAGRKDNTVLNKMSYFFLQVNSKKGMAKYAASH